MRDKADHATFLVTGIDHAIAVGLRLGTLLNRPAQAVEIGPAFMAVGGIHAVIVAGANVVFGRAADDPAQPVIHAGLPEGRRAIRCRGDERFNGPPKGVEPVGNDEPLGIDGTEHLAGETVMKEGAGETAADGLRDGQGL